MARTATECRAGRRDLVPGPKIVKETIASEYHCKQSCMPGQRWGAPLQNLVSGEGANLHEKFKSRRRKSYLLDAPGMKAPYGGVLLLRGAVGESCTPQNSQPTHQELRSCCARCLCCAPSGVSTGSVRGSRISPNNRSGPPWFPTQRGPVVWVL